MNLYKNYRRFYAIVETLKIHGQIEYGTDAINIDKLAEYICSDEMFARVFDCPDNQVDEIILDDILNGMPVWRFFNLPKWTENMLEKEYAQWVDRLIEDARLQREADKRRYKCLQGCVYFSERDCSIGHFVKCKKTKLAGSNFKFRCQCKYFSVKQEVPESPPSSRDYCCWNERDE